MDEKVIRSSRWKKISTIAIVVCLLVGAFVFLMSHPRGSVTGEIRSTGKPHGDFVVKPVTCYSGGHWDFNGVWVVTETLTSGSKRGFKGGLKIVKNDAGGLETYVENPRICQGFQCKLTRVNPQYCNVFNVNVEERNIWMRYNGAARFDCTFPEGGTLKADLDFRGCALVSSGSAEADL